jgi:tellurite resistance protein
MIVDSAPLAMPTEDKINLLAKVARTPALRDERGLEENTSEGAGAVGGDGGSILSLAAASYGAKPVDDATVPTGFDPMAIALFEAIVEAAYLVAAADGVVDDEERSTFERVVTAACGGAVARKHIGELVADLQDQLSEDGMDRRIEIMGKTIVKKSHAQEVLRIAALIAQASESVSDVERDVLVRIAASCGLVPGDVDVALREVKEALET